MIKVIETNIISTDLEPASDAQSRVIEVENWEKYVAEIEKREVVHRRSILGFLHGPSLPRGVKIISFHANGQRLICTFYRIDGTLQMKIAYVV